MSQTLTRLRSATGDPLLVRAGHGLVATPRAAELRDRVHELTRDARAVLRTQIAPLDMASLEQTFTIRASDAFLEFPVGARRGGHHRRGAARPLREGLTDLEIGVHGTAAPEVRTQTPVLG